MVTSDKSIHNSSMCPLPFTKLMLIGGKYHLSLTSLAKSGLAYKQEKVRRVLRVVWRVCNNHSRHWECLSGGCRGLWQMPGLSLPWVRGHPQAPAAPRGVGGPTAGRGHTPPHPNSPRCLEVPWLEGAKLAEQRSELLVPCSTSRPLLRHRGRDGSLASWCSCSVPLLHIWSPKSHSVTLQPANEIPHLINTIRILILTESI